MAFNLPVIELLEGIVVLFGKDTGQGTIQMEAPGNELLMIDDVVVCDDNSELKIVFSSFPTLTSYETT